MDRICRFKVNETCIDAIILSHALAPWWNLLYFLQFQIALERGCDDITKYSDGSCTCTAGKGFCQHQVALLYQMAHFQALGLTKVPEIASSTSAPQQWHIPPRTHGFKCRPIGEVTVVKPVPPAIHEPEAKRKREQPGIKSKLYNPVTVPLLSIGLKEKLLPSMLTHAPMPQWTQLWSANSEPRIVDSAYGPVPYGSLIAVQCKKIPQEVPRVGPESPPPFQLPELAPLKQSYFPLLERQQVLLSSLCVFPEESQQYQLDTQDQNRNQEWHNLRKQRRTASIFKDITSRRGNYQKLAADLLKRRVPKTAAVRFGLENESEAAREYSQRYAVDVHPVGLVINPSRSFLGCSPDRRVFDPEADPQWGLLEFKCSTEPSLHQIKYLKPMADNSGYELRKSHKYYEQCMGQMGLTGAAWCDFFVWSEGEFLREWINFDQERFSAMLQKLDNFFFDYYLPTLVDQWITISIWDLLI